MTPITYRYADHNLVSIPKFKTSILRVMEKTQKLMGGRCHQALMPTLIGIDVDYNGLRDAVPLFRKFLNELITLREKHFVRFVTDTLWALESDKGHIFYTYDGPKTAWCDVVWTVRAMGPDQVEIEVTAVPNNPIQGLMTDLSSSLKKFIPGQTRPEIASIEDVMYRFYKNTQRVYQTTHLNENFHILLVPSPERKGYYPIPIHGMSYTDAQRHYRQVTQQQDHLVHNHYELFNKAADPAELLHAILTLIQANHRFDCRGNPAQERYALAELAFGLCATHHRYERSDHDLILFNMAHEDFHSADIHRLSMTKMMRYC
jgi:hypothetical protein